MKKLGILFTLLGVTNTGKTTQQKLLEDHLRQDGYRVTYVKYPVYDLLPTGPRINAYLRQGNPEKITAQEFHELQIQKLKMADVEAGKEFGTMIEAKVEIAPGDKLQAITLVKK